MDKVYKSGNGNHNVYVTEWARFLYEESKGYIFQFKFGNDLHFFGATEKEGAYSNTHLITAVFKLKKRGNQYR